MQILSLYRITSHKQVVEVDDTSISPNKVSKQVVIFQKSLPDQQLITKVIEGSAVGTILVVDAFKKATFNPFDLLVGTEANLKVVKEISIDGITAILCVPGDFLTFFLNQKLKHISKIFEIKIITLSDRAYRGIYDDKSGSKAAEILSEYFKKIEKPAVVRNIILPDESKELNAILEESKEEKTDIIITTGGTGIGSRDITVETVQKNIDKEIPGIMEMIRLKYGADNPNALLSRGVAGTMKKTLVYTLPGNVKAVNEYLAEIIKTLEHLIYMIHEIDIH